MATSSIPAPRLEALRKEVFDCSRCGFCRVWDWKGVNWVCPTYPYTEAYDTQYARALEHGASDPQGRSRC